MSSSKSVYTIEWLGFNAAPNYNQVWGYVTMSDERVFTFWGKKGGRILFKQHSYTHHVSYVSAQKEKKGFKQIDLAHYELICPGFKDDFEIWLTSAILADSF